MAGGGILFSLVILTIILGSKVLKETQETRRRAYNQEETQGFSWQPPASPFGFSGTGYWWDSYVDSSLPLWKESGARWIRETVNWVFVQNKKSDLEQGIFHWEALDRHLNRFTQAGIMPLLVLGFNVEEESGGGLKEVVSCPDLTPVYYEPHLKRRISYWENYVFHLVARYGKSRYDLGPGYRQGKVRYWEIWNEPDFKGGGTYLTPQDYQRLVKATYRIIKEVDPGAKVVFGGLSDEISPGESEFSGSKLLPRTREYLQGVIGNGSTCSYFDILGIHPYRALRQNKLVDYVHEIERFLKDRHCEKPIWITEIGLTGSMRGSSQGEDGFSEAVKRAYREVIPGGKLYQKVKKVFWYRLTPNCSNCSLSEESFSLVSCQKEDSQDHRCLQWERRKGFFTYKQLAWQHFWQGRELKLAKTSSLQEQISRFYWESATLDSQPRRIFWGEDAEKRGLVKPLSGGVVVEDGSVLKPEEGCFYLHPYWDSKGYIKGTGEIQVPWGERVRLRLLLAFPKDREGTDGVRVKVEVKDPANPKRFPLLAEKSVFYDQRKKVLWLDMTPYRGEKVALILTQLASPTKKFAGNSYRDLLVWCMKEQVEEVKASQVITPSPTVAPTRVPVTNTPVPTASPIPTAEPSPTGESMSGCRCTSLLEVARFASELVEYNFYSQNYQSRFDCNGDREINSGDLSACLDKYIFQQ